ncbi:hypothetical protein ADUPG1_001906 [Aduncisulcus paluster]|uniref:Uncharacterized protein n=1 Tax=Aduncisulcus paluster TaxID=2918883 RepID=A0ABQ5KFB0_9EUKA|nr:hypothetical protein ADUPG1_001906 [Aduncisulcus paluster]
MKLINLSTDEKDNEEGRKEEGREKKEGRRRKGEEGKVVKREESSGYTMGIDSMETTGIREHVLVLI